MQRVENALIPGLNLNVARFDHSRKTGEGHFISQCRVRWAVWSSRMKEKASAAFWMAFDPSIKMVVD